MDKYEYKVRADEIKSLIAEGEFAEAVKIADTIDWRRVRSVMMLCTVSDLYKVTRRYQESKEILLMAYDKHPTGRAIVYSLCELSIKMEEYIQAVEYYKEFVRIAPKDTGKYILLYRLYEAQDASLEERIAVLEELKKREYREKWAYELAYLYHRIGFTTKCIEECDEMYLWFGEGKYVLKALELKALHVPLSAEQQEKHDIWIRLQAEEALEESVPVPAVDDEEENEQPQESSTENEVTDSDNTPSSDIMSLPTTELPEVKTVDVGQYNTLNLQMVVAEGLKEVMPEEVSAADNEPDVEEAAEEREVSVTEDNYSVEEGFKAEETAPSEESFETEEAAPAEESFETEEGAPAEDSFEAEEAASAEDSFEAEETASAEDSFEAEKASSAEDSFEAEEVPSADEGPVVEENAADEEPSIAEKLIAPLLQQTAEMPEVEMEEPERPYIRQTLENVQGPANINRVRYDDVLSQENDGQIRLVMPDPKVVEKQITGQLSIEDIMAEWEEMKKSNEQKRMEEVRQRILNRTGSLFAEFDEATKSGLLEEMERAFMEAMAQSSEKEPVVKKVTNDAKDAEMDLLKAAIAAEDNANELKRPAKKEPVKIEERETANAADGTGSVESSRTETVIKDDTQTVKGEQHVQEKRPLRELTEEEKELFSRCIQHRRSREQLINTLDNMSMAAYTGNVIITGEEDGATVSLAKNLIREMQSNDSNFSGKIAKISAASLNKKDIAETLNRLSNGALIIEKAADLNNAAITKFNKVLQNENAGLLLILEDTKKRINTLLAENESLERSFNLRIDIEPLDDEALVAYAKQYAQENEYSIDEFGVLALHTRIADMQTSDHEVSVSEVREIVDDAIYYANKKTPKHFFDILLAKRYDDEDMIILREKDFMHY